MSNFADSFPQRLTQLRKASNLTQREVADTLGVTARTVQYWESGAKPPARAHALALAELFNVSVDYLLGRTDNPDPAHTPEIDPDIDADVSGLTAEEREVLAELKREAAWHDYLQHPERRRELVRVVKTLIRVLREETEDK